MKKKILALSLTAIILICSVPVMVAAQSEDSQLQAADLLNSYGLFRGTDKGYELERPGNRVEALVMLVRLLGEEDAALAGTSPRHPFDDVPAWADNYVSYAYQKGYTNGVSITKYGSTNIASAAMYITFVLRALGYDDSRDDFNWRAPWDTLSERIGVTQGEYSEESEFTRGDMCIVSVYALNTRLKNQNMTLFTKLKTNGAISAAAVFPGGTKDNDTRIFLSEYDITIPMGTVDYAIEVSCDYAGDFSFSGIIRDDDYSIDYMWGEWVKSENGHPDMVPLNITALDPGIATIYIIFRIDYRAINPYELRVLNITVK